MNSSEYVTLVLAGCQVERLSLLTKEKAKPTITFGGVFHLIDFTLSNCKHSNVGDIGIITQIFQHDIEEYVGSGSQWFQENQNVKITMLSPRVKNGMCELYNGTANAILKNEDYVDQKNPKSVLVLPGDHVYKMNYAEVLDAHEKSGAAVTIAARRVAPSDASHFDIIDIGRGNSINSFEEKPKQPKSNLASMGIYVFDWAVLKEYLHKCSHDSKFGMDIGSTIIPRMLSDGEKLDAHIFNGYWKEVGNIQSFWEANMDLLSVRPGIDLDDDRWKIISREHGALRHYEHSYLGSGHIVNSLVAENCTNNGTIMRSVVSEDVVIGDDAAIIDSVILPGARIGRGSFVFKAIIGAQSIIADYTPIGSLKPDGYCLDSCQGINVVGNNVKIYRHSSGRSSFAVLARPGEVYAM